MYPAIQAIKKFFGLGPKRDYGQLVKQGAIVLDVRTKGEFAGGHIKNALNIPVDQLSKDLSKFKDKNKVIICCCASGMRSSSAANILKSQGYTQVFNGGNWRGLNNKINV